jgi:hypothetical protein
MYLIAEDDVHYASLTVKQTLMFALKTRTPRLGKGMSQNKYRRRFLDILVKVFGIVHTLDTRVGNEVCSYLYLKFNDIVHPRYFRGRKEKSINCRNHGESWCRGLLGQFDPWS